MAEQLCRIEVVNWEKFQHYKDRSPPWIKLHRSVLDSRQWAALDGDASKLLVECWLIASESDDGSWEGDLDDLAWRLRRTTKQLTASLEAIEAQGLIRLRLQDASAVLATCSTEERREEGEKETEKRRARATQLPDDWKPNDHHAELARGKGVVIGEEAAHFKDYHLAKGSTFKDWDRAFNTWLRNAKKFQRGTPPSPNSQAVKVRSEKPQQPGNRTGTISTPGGRTMEEESAVLAKWKREHPEEVTTMWNDAVEELGEKLTQVARFSENSAQKMVESVVNSRILTEKVRAA